MEHNIETEQDLQRLIGQYESLRLDFKDSRLLAQDKQRIIKQLTEDVSAFANTEGGVIVIGMREGKAGKKSVAIQIDEGVDPSQMPPEKLEDMVAENISPRIHGLTVRPVQLSGSKAGRVAYVITVPKGNTAYQAAHSLLYYERTEFAAKPLHDRTIRLLMTRRQMAHAVIEKADISQARKQPVTWLPNRFKCIPWTTLPTRAPSISPLRICAQTGVAHQCTRASEATIQHLPILLGH